MPDAEVEICDGLNHDIKKMTKLQKVALARHVPDDVS